MRAFPLSLCLIILLFLPAARGAESFFKKGDVIALVGGEDMVVASELGYLEMLLVRALPDYHLRFRNLAWEGDTVFEQRRDLNFPTWEEQLDKIGATVVIVQFGQMESLAASQSAAFHGRLTAEDAKAAEGRRGTGKENPSAGLSNPSASSAVKSATDAVAPPAQQGLPEFIAAYEKLIERFKSGGKRRIAFISPSPFAGDLNDPRNQSLLFFSHKIAVWSRLHGRSVDYSRSILSSGLSARRAATKVLEMPLPPGIRVEQARSAALATLEASAVTHRDDAHLSAQAHARAAHLISFVLNPSPALTPSSPVTVAFHVPQETDPLLQAIRAKNRLWFDYWRPQNWAFLAGDRTAQPSSRDHLDPSKRWFPPEREAFLPLIEAKEKEIDALAAQLAGK